MAVSDGKLSGELLGGPRILFASARDGNLPSFLAKVHPKYHTPHAAIIFFTIVIAAFALTGTFAKLATVASGSVLIVDFAVCLAVIKFRRRDGLPAKGQFRLPFGPAIPLLACTFIGGLLLQIPNDEAVSVGILLGVCVAGYGLRSIIASRRKRPTPPA